MENRPGLTLDDRVRKIRDLVNDTRKQHQLVKDSEKWSRLCSAMDAIGDAEYAILAHREARHTENRLDFGVLYLAHYGFMQALYLQQDAVKHLRESLGILGFDVMQNPILREVRDARNDVAHPTNRLRGNTRSYHGIVRSTMKSEGFDLYSFSAAGVSNGWKKVVCQQVADAQSEELSKALDEVIAHLEAEAKAHKDQYGTKLLTPLVSNFGYPMEKVIEAALGMSREIEISPEKPAVALVMLNAIEEGINGFAKELEERGWFPEVHEGFDISVNQGLRTVKRLRRIFSEGAAVVDDVVDIEGVAQLLRDHLEDLRRYAVDLDRYYRE